MVSCFQSRRGSRGLYSTLARLPSESENMTIRTLNRLSMKIDSQKPTPLQTRILPQFAGKVWSRYFRRGILPYVHSPLYTYIHLNYTWTSSKLRKGCLGKLEVICWSSWLYLWSLQKQRSTIMVMVEFSTILHFLFLVKSSTNLEIKASHLSAQFQLFSDCWATLGLSSTPRKVTLASNSSRCIILSWEPPLHPGRPVTGYQVI